MKTQSHWNQDLDRGEAAAWTWGESSAAHPRGHGSLCPPEATRTPFPTT